MKKFVIALFAISLTAPMFAQEAAAPADQPKVEKKKKKKATKKQETKKEEAPKAQ
jgi:Ni/Co efflux regulator RcnB